MTESLRSIAISVRQPWAWLIVNNLKPIENRDWDTKQRGRMFIHAGGTMTRPDYEACKIFIAGFSDIKLPAFEELKQQCGGLVGVATLDKVFTRETIKSQPDHLQNWFTGQYGFLFQNPQTITFEPYKGRLGFFPIPYATTCRLQPLPLHLDRRNSVSPTSVPSV